MIDRSTCCGLGAGHDPHYHEQIGYARARRELLPCWDSDPIVAAANTGSHGDAHLTGQESRLLALLVKHMGRVVPYGQILREALLNESIPGDYAPEEDRHVVRVHASRLRRKLGDHASRFVTSAGVGIMVLPPHGTRKARPDDN